MHESKTRALCLRNSNQVSPTLSTRQGFLGRYLQSGLSYTDTYQHLIALWLAAVNTYFRAVLAEQVLRADFEPKEYAQHANCQTPQAPHVLQDTGSKEQLNFDSIPATVLEHVLKHCNLLTACNAANACRSLHQVGFCQACLVSLCCVVRNLGNCLALC